MTLHQKLDEIKRNADDILKLYPDSPSPKDNLKLLAGIEKLIEQRNVQMRSAPMWPSAFNEQEEIYNSELLKILEDE